MSTSVRHMHPPEGALAAAAVRYAENGWHVFPLVPREKAPLLSGGGGFRGASTDIDRVRRWWAEHPDANIGMWPGKSGLVVLDIDGPLGEDAARALGALSEPTLCVATGRDSGGRHLYFRRPPFTVSNVDLAAKLDIRGDAGYVVLPPSVHPSGRRYRWLGHDEIRELPPRLLEALRAAQEGWRWTETAISTDPESARIDAGAMAASRIALSEAIIEGRRNSTLTRYAGRLLSRGLPENEVITLLDAMNQAKCEPPLPQEEVATLVRSIGAREARKPRAGPISDAPGAGTRPRSSPAVSVTSFSQIEARQIDWLWRHRIPRGTLTLIEGAAGIGKTSVVVDLLARVSRGVPLPEEEGAGGGDVLIVGPEDSASAVLRPRLEAAGADLTRVHLVEPTTADGETGVILLPADIGALREALQRCAAPRVLYIDALNDLLAGVRVNDDTEVRAALRPLARLAEEFGIAVLATRHFGKGGSRQAALAGIGSVGFGAVARSILQVYRDGNDSDQLLLASAKSNLGPPTPTLAFRLQPVGEDGPPRVVWAGRDPRSAEDLQHDYRADRATVRGERGGALETARTWLRARLADGLPVPRSEVVVSAREAGISEATLKRAASSLDVVMTPAGFGRGTEWSLAVPSHLHPAHSAPSGSFPESEPDGAE